MPHHSSYKKTLRKEAKAKEKNKAVRSAIRTSLKTIRTAETKEEALQEMPNLFSMMDKAALKGRAGFTVNKSANYKAKVSKIINSFD
ncbi:MAG: 30S ribosomal protein S20 [Fibrobacter sp.]|nr:30S ribosomal protein S20 [Fibrobacter sp.]